MRFREQLKSGLQAWQPSTYRSLTAQSMRSWLRIAGTWLLLCLLLMLLVGIPQINAFGKHTNEFFAAFSSFSLTANVSLNETTTIAKQPKIVVSDNQTAPDHERILINEQGIFIKRPFWQGVREISWDEITDVQGHAASHSQWLTLLAILLLPSLLVLLAAAFIIEAAVLMLIIPPLILLCARLLRLRISAKQASKVSVIALIPLSMLQLIPFLYVQLIFIPLGIYLLLVIGGCWVVGESKLEGNLP